MGARSSLDLASFKGSPKTGSFLNPEGFADKRTYQIGNREAAIREPHVRERDIEKKGFQAQGRGLVFCFIKKKSISK